jgi:hypothetical protein
MGNAHAKSHLAIARSYRADSRDRITRTWSSCPIGPIADACHAWNTPRSHARKGPLSLSLSLSLSLTHTPSRPLSLVRAFSPSHANVHKRARAHTHTRCGDRGNSLNASLQPRKSCLVLLVSFCCGNVN